MRATLQKIENAVSPLRQDESLLFLNRLLAVQRDFVVDVTLTRDLKALGTRPIAYVVHFLAMQLLQHSSIFGVPILNWPGFVELLNMLHDLPDPIEDDPMGKDANATACLERIAQQQLPSQDRNKLKKLGLYLGLFRDVGVVGSFDLRQEIEATLEMTIDEFMALGVVCGALRIADFSVGTFTADYLTDAYSQGIRVCVPERWGPFLRRICCTPRQFRQRQSAFSAGSLAYPQFEFNLVRQYPISEITPNHFLAIDPELIIERAAYGLFYDLFDRDGFEFSRNFGASFEKFVGMLLGSADMAGVLWSHADWQAANPTATIQGKVSDHAYVSNNATILFECKSLRPTVKLITVADESSMSDITNRIAEGLRQLIEHNDAIKSGHWVTAGLPQRDAAAFVLVMYGQLYTVNGALWRVLIKAQLKKLGLEPGPFVVLSISDLDSVISLVERGHSLESIVVKLCNEENSLSDFPELRTDSVSSFSRERASQLLEEITSRSTAEKR